MARSLVLVALAALLAPAIAGCISPGAEDAPIQPAGAIGTAVEGYHVPTGLGAISFLDSYVMTHPFRLAASADTMATARDSLHAELESFGLTVERHEYSGSGVNILGIREGTVHPDEWIVLSAHYDTTETTVFGAWDDGAGVALLLELAKSASTREFNRTIVFAFFDEEEQGLVGSRNFVADYQENVNLVANINFDPPGLNWPCADAQGYFPVKIIFNQEKIDTGLAGYPELRDAVLHALDAAEVPEEVRDYDSGIPIAVVGGVGVRGSSDHVSFDRIDIPNVFLGGTPTSHAGPISALTYLLHSPLDTKEQMVLRCGSEALLAEAFHVHTILAVHTVDMLDRV